MDEFNEPTRLPIAFDDEDPFLALWEYSLSLRQILTLLMFGVIWYLLMKATVFALPISEVFGALVWAWIPLIGGILAFKKVDGRPLEEMLAKWMLYMVGPRRWIPLDPKAKYGSVEDANWAEIEQGSN